MRDNGEWNQTKVPRGVSFKWIAILSLGIVILLPLVLYRAFLGEWALLTEGPLVRWSDGTSLTVVASEYAAETHFDGSRSWLGWLHFQPQSNYGTGSSDYSVATHYSGSTLTGAEVKAFSRRWMITVRARRADGSKWVIPKFFSNTGISSSLERDGGHPAAPLNDSAAPLELVGECEDGAGGWIPLAGPIMPSSADDRGVFLSDCFPHDLSTVKVRFSRPNFPSLIIDVKNPDYHTTSARWTPEDLPLTKDFPDASVTVQDLTLQHVDDQYWGIHFHLDFVPKNGPREALNPGVAKISDEWGNEMGSRFLPGFSGYPILPSTRRIRISYNFDRSDKYPWPISDTVIIGEGVWPTPGATPSVKITSAGAALGINDLSIPRVSNPGSFDLHLKAQMTSTRWASFKTTFRQAQLAAIYTTEPLPTGNCQFMGGGSSVNATIELHSNWKVTGKVDAGKAFRIGLCKPPPPTVAEFIVEAPEMPAH